MVSKGNREASALGEIWVKNILPSCTSESAAKNGVEAIGTGSDMDKNCVWSAGSRPGRTEANAVPSSDATSFKFYNQTFKHQHTIHTIKSSNTSLSLNVSFPRLA